MRIVAQVTERNVTRLQKGGAAFAVLPTATPWLDVRYIQGWSIGNPHVPGQVWIDNADGTVLEG